MLTTSELYNKLIAGYKNGMEPTWNKEARKLLTNFHNIHAEVWKCFTNCDKCTHEPTEIYCSWNLKHNFLYKEPICRNCFEYRLKRSKETQNKYINLAIKKARKSLFKNPDKDIQACIKIMEKLFHYN